MDGVAASSRDDVQLVCWSLGVGDVVPDDPRIVIAEPYRGCDAATYATRLAACDALALVFDPDGDMLATGTAADAQGLGLPVLASDWGYLTEALGAGIIPCGHTAASIAAAVDALTPEVLAASAAAITARRADYEWGPIATPHRRPLRARRPRRALTRLVSGRRSDARATLTAANRSGREEGVDASGDVREEGSIRRGAGR